MPAYRHTCVTCHQRTALAALTEIRPAVFECDTCQDMRGHAADMAHAAQVARDRVRDYRVSRITGHLNQATRDQLSAWHYIREQQKHGGATW